MKKTIAAILSALFVSHAFAEEPPPQVQAMFNRINAEVNANLQCTTSAIALTQQLKELQEKIKALQQKYEPVPDKKIE